MGRAAGATGMGLWRSEMTSPAPAKPGVARWVAGAAGRALDTGIGSALGAAGGAPEGHSVGGLGASA